MEQNATKLWQNGKNGENKMEQKTMKWANYHKTSIGHWALVTNALRDDMKCYGCYGYG